MTASAQSDRSQPAAAAPRARRKAGRPTKLNAKLQASICELLEKGVPTDAAAVSLGVARRTFFDWLERGRNGEPLYTEFMLAVDQAINVWHAKTVGVAGVDPRNAMTMLERRFPKDWGKQDRMAVDVSVSHRPMIDPSKYTVEEMELLRRLLAKGAPEASELPRDGVAAGELVAGIIEGELVSEEEVA